MMTIDDRIDGFLKFHSRKWVEYLRELVHKAIGNHVIDEADYDKVIALVLMSPESPYFNNEFVNDVV